MLLSYLDVEKDGYKPENVLFEADGITVSTGANSATLTFDKSHSKMNSDTTHINVLNSVTNHFSFTGSTQLFDYLPVSFGLNMGSSHSYSDGTVRTTHLTVHSSLNLSVSGGSVSDPIYEYKITPYIYQHAALGCLMLAWKVDAFGRAWAKQSEGGDARVAFPRVCLIRPVPNSKDLVYRALSRSISFRVNRDTDAKPDGTVDILVEIFNNSFGNARDVLCRFFSGKPELSEDGTKLEVPANPLGEVKLASLESLKRTTVALGRQTLTTPMYVTVELSLGKIHQGIYWNAYPPEETVRRVQ